MTIVGCSKVWLGVAKFYEMGQMHVGSNAVFTVLIITHLLCQASFLTCICGDGCCLCWRGRAV